MPETTHTPGPWVMGELTNPDDGTKHVAIQREGVTQGAVCLISSVSLFDAQDAANARLIAAAPDLLAACKQMQKSLNGSPSDFQGMLAAHRAIDAAVAKAKGA